MALDCRANGSRKFGQGGAHSDDGQTYDHVADTQAFGDGACGMHENLCGYQQYQQAEHQPGDRLQCRHLLKFIELFRYGGGQFLVGPGLTFDQAPQNGAQAQQQGNTINKAQIMVECQCQCEKGRGQQPWQFSPPYRAGEWQRCDDCGDTEHQANVGNVRPERVAHRQQWVAFKGGEQCYQNLRGAGADRNHRQTDEHFRYAQIGGACRCSGQEFIGTPHERDKTKD